MKLSLKGKPSFKKSNIFYIYIFLSILDHFWALLTHVFGKCDEVLITSVSSSDHSYLQFTFDFMTLTQNFNISYFKQKRKSHLSESLD